jgi:ketosteroid isomerase-like protein
MRKLLYILIFFVPISVYAQLTPTLQKEQIKLVMKIQEQNWNLGKIESFMDGYWKSDSLLFIGSKGPTYGWQQTLDNYKKSYSNKSLMGQLTFGLIKVELINSKSAFVVGTWRLNRKNDVLKGHYTLLWKKIEGEWKIVIDHSS